MELKKTLCPLRLSKERILRIDLRIKLEDRVLKRSLKKKQRWYADATTNVTTATTFVATTQAKGIKLKLSKNI